jgi:hypothetical protein
MSTKSSKTPAGAPAPELPADQMDRIRQVASAISPTPMTVESVFGDLSAQLDNVGWVDFTEVRTFLEPAVRPQTDPSGFSILTREERDMLAGLSAEDLDARDYEAEFYAPFREAVAAGVCDNILCYYGVRHYTGQTLAQDPANGTIVVSYTTGAGGQPQQIVYDVRAIVDRLFLGLPYADLADMADSYFSIYFASTSDLWAAKEAFFSRVRCQFFDDAGVGIGATWILFQLYSEANKAALTGVMAQRRLELWGRLKANLLQEFGAGEEDLGALEDAWTFRAPPPPAEHPFMTFVPGELNLGLRLVYRQEWRPLGIQRGEVIRTIPLGPRQSEKVSTKVTRRTKVSKASEDLKSTEASTERSDTRKDSSEIVEEASRSMKWNLNQEIEGGFNAGICKISSTTNLGLARESAQSSKETSARLSETMQKIASKTRNETKVSVSTEFESSYEATTATEIQNPNDEIAITYVYSKLQTQYEVLTALAEVHDVVMVAEDLPTPAEIGFDWVKRHDWIIAKALLDDSFRDALASISQEVPHPDGGALLADLKKARDDSIGHLGSFAGAAAALSATSIDFTRESQRAYRTTARERLERLRHDYALDAKRHRLYEHIRQNLLHYCRAVWQQEDPQQRILRYRKRDLQVPVDWMFLPRLAPQMTIDEFAECFGQDSESGLTGEFRADPEGRTVPLVDLVNPAGPIGFYGNYALFYLRPEFTGEGGFQQLLDIFKAPYTAFDPELQQTVVVDPVLAQIAARVAENEIADEAIKACQDEMIDYVPELRLAYLKARRSDDPAKLQEFLDDLGPFRRCFAEYLFRKQQARRFLVDSNNLMIDILPGRGSALEPFKQAHRAIDALKAEEDRVRASLENQRRRALMANAAFGDPDVDRLVVVADGEKIDLAALFGLTGPGA